MFGATLSNVTVLSALVEARLPPITTFGGDGRHGWSRGPSCPTRRGLYTVGPPLTTTDREPGAVEPANEMSVLVNPDTAALNVAVKLIVRALVGSA